MMGMMKRDKNIASLILGEALPSGDTASGDLRAMGCEACAEKILGAVEAKDPRALADSMREMISMIMDELSMREG